MKLTLRHIYTFLFLLGIFFIPFNSWEGIKELAEFKRESSAIFFFLGFLFVILEIVFTKKIFIYNNPILIIVLIFLLWNVLTIVFNFPSVLDNYYKKTPGLNRFIRQFISLLISCGMFFILYLYSLRHIETENILYKIRKILLCSLIFSSIYSFFEIIYIITGFFPAYKVLLLFDYFPFVESDNHGIRISSVSWEPPALATFLITISGWMFSYILTSKNLYKYLPTLLVLILTYYSGSRTALIVVFIQLIAFFFIYLSKKQLVRFLKSSIVIILLLSTFIFITKPEKILNDIGKKIESLDFKGNLKKNISNQSRFGIQYANFMVFLENPFVGVGYGQQVYHAIDYYPIWAKKDNWEFKYLYLNKNEPAFPPGYNLYIRLLAETGIIGFLIFIFLIYTLFKKSYSFIRNDTSEIKTLGMILFISFIGYSFNFFQLDTFRIYGFWFCVAITLTLSSRIYIGKK